MPRRQRVPTATVSLVACLAGFVHGCAGARATTVLPDGTPRRPPHAAPGDLSLADLQAIPEGIVDPAAERAFIAGAGGLEALDLRSGALLWTSSEAVRPFVIAGDRLVAATAPGAESGAILNVVVIDPRDGRRLAPPASVRIPGAWYATAGPRVEDGRFILAWQTVAPPLPRECGGMVRPPRPPMKPPPLHEGVAVVDLRSGAVEVGMGAHESLPEEIARALAPLPVLEGARTPLWRTAGGGYAAVVYDRAGGNPSMLWKWDHDGSGHAAYPLGLPAPEERRYVRAYGRHVVIQTDHLYGKRPSRLTFHSLEGAPVAELASSPHCEGAPALAGDRILCLVSELPPAAPRWGTLVVPRSLVAYDPATGTRLWSRPVTPAKRDLGCPPLP